MNMINNLIEMLKILSKDKFEDIVSVDTRLVSLAIELQRNYLLDNLIKEVEGIKVAINVNLDRISDDLLKNTNAIDELTSKISDTIKTLNT